jgi:hypothetical protein
MIEQAAEIRSRWGGGGAAGRRGGAMDGLVGAPLWALQSTAARVF